MRIPVSYTHLDVYKRQWLFFAIVRITELLPAKRWMTELLNQAHMRRAKICHGRLFIHVTEQRRQDESHLICLLYTSRCV